MIDESEILRRIQEDIDRHIDSEDIIDKSIVCGLKMAYDDVLLCEFKEGRHD